MDKQALWDQACQVMHTEMTEVTFNTWIKSALRPLGCSGDQFFIEAVTDFYHQFVVPRYAVLVSNSLTEVAGRPLKAVFLTPAQADEYRAGMIPEEKSADGSSLTGLNAGRSLHVDREVILVEVYDADIVNDNIVFNLADTCCRNRSKDTY